MANRESLSETLQSLLPWWAWLAIATVVTMSAAALGVTVIAAGSQSDAAARNLDYQCESAIGANPNDTQPDTPPVKPAAAPDAFDPDELPDSNPYASLTAAPDDSDISDWMRDCLSGPMRTAAFQQPPIAAQSNGFAGRCARILALRYRDSSAAAPAGSVIRRVIYQASSAAITERCESVNGDHVPAPADNGCQSSTDAIRGRPTAVVLPLRLAGQAMCGQRVALTALSPGDLVFWDFREHAPTRAGIAVGENLLVTVDPNSGHVGTQSVPAGRSVLVKRVLGGTG